MTVICRKAEFRQALRANPDIPSAISALAEIAAQVNARSENIGARRLHTVLERLLEDLSFSAPELSEQEVTIDAAYVHQRLDPIVKNEDLSRYIL